MAHRAKLCLDELISRRSPKTRELELPISETFESGLLAASPWWAVYTRHQHEKVVAEMLSAKGFEVFLPLYESTRRWKDRRKVLHLPLFPCYLFVRGGIDRKLQVVTTPGIHMILYRGDQVAIIPDRELKRFKEPLMGLATSSPIRFSSAARAFESQGDPLKVWRGF